MLGCMGSHCRHAATIKRLVGLVTTDEGFYWRLTGRENLAFLLHGAPPNTAERIDAVLAQLDLYDFADKPLSLFDRYAATAGNLPECCPGPKVVIPL